MKKQKLAIGAVMFWCIMALSGAAWCGDNGNGTVTVNGLVWLKDAGCGYMDWLSAMTRPKYLAHGKCGLTDNSKAGDWRLPTLEELEAAYPYKGQFKNVHADYYWSSSTFDLSTTVAFYVDMDDGLFGNDFKGNSHYVWPVRAGR